MGNKNILLAEDDPSLRLMVATVLKHMGHKVQLASDGKQALYLFAQDPALCDVLITDHSMPVVTGLELVSQLRKDGFTGKIIVMSGSLTPELVAAYRAKHVNKILQKPFRIENLSSALGSLLEALDAEGPADGSKTL